MSVFTKSFFNALLSTTDSINDHSIISISNYSLYSEDYDFYELKFKQNYTEEEFNVIYRVSKLAINEPTSERFITIDGHQEVIGEDVTLF